MLMLMAKLPFFTEFAFRQLILDNLKSSCVEGGVLFCDGQALRLVSTPRKLGSVPDFKSGFLCVLLKYSAGFPYGS